MARLLALFLCSIVTAAVAADPNAGLTERARAVAETENRVRQQLVDAETA